MLVFLKNCNDSIKEIMVYSLTLKTCLQSEPIPSDVKFSGIFSSHRDEKIRGLVRPRVSGVSDHTDFFFIDKSVYFFKGATLSSSIEYDDNHNAKFILKENGRIIESVTYSRKPNYGLPSLGIAIGEEYNDVFHIIHDCLERSKSN